MKRIKVFYCVLLIMILGLIACGSDAEEIEWKNIVLGDVIPEPQSNLMEIFTNDDEALDVYIHDMSENDFLEYVGWCEEQKDFNIDTEKDTSSFSGYNKEGYYLSLYYDDSEDEMNIDLQIPIVLKEFELPSYATAIGVPVPKSNLGQYEWNDEDGFRLFVGNTTLDDFKEYKDNCIKAGFTVDPYEYETFYSAENAKGYELSVEHKGFNRIEIKLYCPEEKSENDDSATDNDDNSESTTIITVTMSEDDFIGLTYTEVEELLKKMGFVNFEYETLDASDLSKIDDTVGAVEIKNWVFGKGDFSKGDTYESDAIVVIWYYENSEIKDSEDSESETENKAVFYSTNDYETATKGNTGVFSYKNKSGSYDVYWIIDFNEGYTYFFTEGNGEDYCDKVKITSGTLNDRVTITWNIDGEKTNWYLHFKYVNSPVTLIVNDHFGVTTEFTTTDLSKALRIRDTKTIK